MMRGPSYLPKGWLEDGDCDKKDTGDGDTCGNGDNEEMDTLPPPNTDEGDLDHASSKSTLLEPRYKVQETI